MNRFKLKSDSSNLMDENSSTDQPSKRKDIKPQNSTQAEVEKLQQAEIDKLRMALLKAIEENELVRRLLSQLRGQMAEVEALYAVASEQNEQLTASNMRLQQELKVAREQLQQNGREKSEEGRQKSV